MFGPVLLVIGLVLDTIEPFFGGQATVADGLEIAGVAIIAIPLLIIALVFVLAFLGVAWAEKKRR